MEKKKELSKDQMDNVCKMGQGNACCRYIISSPDGILCGKDDPGTKMTLDNRVEKMTAQGDNCEGWDMYQER